MKTLLASMALLILVSGCNVIVRTHDHHGPYYDHYRYEKYPHVQKYYYRKRHWGHYHY